MISDICAISADELRSYDDDVEFIRRLFDNVRQTVENKYDQMKRQKEKQMIDTQKKSLANSLSPSLGVFFLSVSLSVFLAF